MFDQTLPVISNLTMSSVEIAKLAERRHDNVVRDLKELEEQGVIALLSFEEREIYNNNNTRTVYRLPFRETMLLVTGYNADLRAKVIDRWMELEQRQIQMSVQPARLLDTREKYDVVKDVMETAKLDEDALTVSMCRDSIRNTILPEINGQQPKALTGPKPFQTHEVLEGLGLNQRQLRSTVSMAGRILAIAYRKEFELEPETELRFIDGAERKVKCYPPEWKGRAEEILKTWLKTNNVVMLPGADQ